MSSEVVLAVALLVGGVGYLTLAWYVWRRRQAPAATALLLSVLGIAIWTSAYAIELTTRAIPTGTVWSTVKYLGIVTVPGALFAFALDYTARARRVTRRTALLLAIEPTLVMIVLCTPPIRELMLTYHPVDAFEHTLWPVPDPEPLFYVHAAYSYSVLVYALSLTAWRMIRLARPYRRPAVLVTLTSLLALSGNAYFNFEYPALTVDPTPLLFTLLMSVLVWGLFRMGMIDLAPIARGTVIEQLTDAVLVLDAYNRVVDANPASAGLFGLPRGQLIGRAAGDLLPSAADLLDSHLPGAVRQVDIPATADTLGRAGATPVHLEVNLSSLLDRGGREAGRVMLLRDVTRRIETEQRLRDMLEAETHLAAVLQTSLRPASLPSVPRVQLAARSLPAGQGSQVSGDFYDVHQALGGDWAMVLGDVAGKGVHAAVVTSMARYTVRALSAQGWSPKQVAEQLNQALLVDTGPERFCTMVYARIGEREPLDGEPVGRAPDGRAPDGRAPDGAANGGRPDGVRLTLALSGHPPPLLRRLDGSIEAVGRPGTALGIVTLPEIEETVVDLLPGEVLLAYTDGVTEARRDRSEFGEERLAWILATAASGLRGRTGVAAASLVANAVADRVMDAVTEFAPTRDDIAVLVLAVA